MNMQALVVGKKCCEPSKDDIRFDLTDSGAELVIKFARPTDAEIKAIKSGAAQFRLAQIDGVIFFLSRFGSLPWMDAPYCWVYSNYTLCTPNPGEGIALTIIFVDAATGILKSTRVVGLSTEFSVALLEMVANQPKPQNRDTYLKSIASIYAQYDTNNLIDLAEVSNE